jgi:hypothetical protein
MSPENHLHSTGKNLIHELCSDTTIGQTDRDFISSHAGRIYETLSSSTIDNTQLAEELALFTNVFRTLTHSESNRLNDIQKIKLAHAFIDVSDDIRIALVKKLEVKKEEEPERNNAPPQGWIAWGMGMASTAYKAAEYGVGLISHKKEKKPITEEELIQSIDQFQEAMQDPNLEISLSKIKELLGLILTSQDRAPEAEKIETMDLKALIDFLAEIHAEKRQQASERLAALTPSDSTPIDSAYEMLSQAISVLHETLAEGASSVQQQLIEYKNNKIKENALFLIPQKLFNSKSLQNTLFAILDKSFAENTNSSAPQQLLKEELRDFVASLLDNVQNHLAVLCEETNLLQLTARMNQKIALVLEVINQPDIAEKELLAALLAAFGYSQANTIETSIQQIDKRCSDHIAALVTKKIYMKPEEEFVYARSIWKGLKGAILAGINKLVRACFELVVLDKYEISSSAGFLKMDSNPLLESLAHHFGATEQLETFKKYGGLISLFMIESFLAEARTIVVESRLSKERGSDIKANENAQQVYQRSVEAIGKQLTEFKKNDHSLVQNGLHTLVSFFGSAIASQQGTEGLFDITTPLVSTLVPAWKEWLSIIPAEFSPQRTEREQREK